MKLSSTGRTPIVDKSSPQPASARKYRKGLFVNSLREKPWQTTRELSAVLGYPAESVVRKNFEAGRIVRRVGNRKWSSYEYALAETAQREKEEKR